ncbi:tripartite tricarboxylate transporter substrate binding protein [Piscinibacter koreensis]|uniref:Tripartite tricarboxylate transporter substrate binding protein n=1 Tax=Piscinibacter koreensis TaxID=2742824 RepID=A0A7Y6TXR2_9BURK|nr:tripartite tricarboxylate transporter substrate binding protein [Schlegelella koreensis]NUZ07326.1 tripartite tricarboxylate transporter substrate binding protein [Schlegelella koreensis]
MNVVSPHAPVVAHAASRPRRRLVAAGLAVAAGLLPGAVLAQDAWPSKPIRIVVPFAAGGTSDILARAFGDKLQASLKQTVIIENKAGAGGVIGADTVAKAPADGYTLLLGTIATHAINPALMPKMPYDALKDFAPVFLIGGISNVVLVGAESPYKSVRDIIAAAKAKPGAVSFASAGQGTSQHMSGETFKLLAGVDMTHVPYKGSAPAIQDVMGGQVPMSFETVTVAAPHIASGKVRALAVTSARRSPALPNVPTLQEAGIPGFDVASWQAFYVRAGTPSAIVQQLNAELERIVAQPDIKARMEQLGVEHSPNTPVQFAEFNRNELAKWQKVVKEGKVQP